MEKINRGGKRQNKPGQGRGGGVSSRTCIVMIYPIDGWIVLKVLLCRMGPSVPTPASQIWPGSRSKRSKVNCKRIFLFYCSVGSLLIPLVLFCSWSGTSFCHSPEKHMSMTLYSLKGGTSQPYVYIFSETYKCYSIICTLYFFLWVHVDECLQRAPSVWTF